MKGRGRKDSRGKRMREQEKIYKEQTKYTKRKQGKGIREWGYILEK